MLSHLIRLPTSGEINSDFSIHLERIYSDQISHPAPPHQHGPIHHTPASRDPLAPNFSTPLTVAILGAFRYQILLQRLDLLLHLQAPYFGNHSTLSGASSVRPHWMEWQVRAHASHLAGLSQSRTVLCVKLTRHVQKPPKFQRFLKKHTVLPHQNSRQCAVEPDSSQR